MGSLIYERSTKVEIEDRALAHLQLVITTKLRRGEPFTFTWREDISIGGGRTVVWLSADSSLVYRYAGSQHAPINRDWLEALAYTANTPSGLYLIPEPTHAAAGAESTFTV